MKRIALIVSLLLLTACSDSSGARKALVAAGYTNIETNGYSVFGCSDDDSFHTKFKANGPTGIKVEGVVCGGWFKGSTIRLD